MSVSIKKYFTPFLMTFNLPPNSSLSKGNKYGINTGKSNFYELNPYTSVFRYCLSFRRSPDIRDCFVFSDAKSFSVSSVWTARLKYSGREGADSTAIFSFWTNSWTIFLAACGVSSSLTMTDSYPKFEPIPILRRRCVAWTMVELCSHSLFFVSKVSISKQTRRILIWLFKFHSYRIYFSGT